MARIRWPRIGCKIFENSSVIRYYRITAVDGKRYLIEPHLPMVFNRDQQSLTTSRAVAATYGKRHDHVSRDIRAILERCSDLDASFVFRKTTYISKYGHSKPMYEMNEEAFSLLVGGFTGAVALRFRIATRYDKPARNFASSVALAAVIIWWVD